MTLEPPQEEKIYLTTGEACDILGIKELNTLYTYIYEGKLKAYKIGGNGKSRRRWRIKRSDLEEFIKSGEHIPEKKVGSKT